MAHVSPQEFENAGNMDELLGLLGRAGIENGWAKREPSMYAKPKKAFIPAQWEWAQARAALDAAGRFVNTELAERRNLILNNPVPGNFYPTVTTLVSAYQMVKAGEVARSHRHTANALRFVAQAEPGLYTVVDGKKIPMEPSDVLLTPNWAWHGHANESKASGYWIDFLDVPLTHLLGPMFFEHHEEMVEHTDIVAPDSLRFHGNRAPFGRGQRHHARPSRNRSGRPRPHHHRAECGAAGEGRQLLHRALDPQLHLYGDAGQGAGDHRWRDLQRKPRRRHRRAQQHFATVAGGGGVLPPARQRRTPHALPRLAQAHRRRALKILHTHKNQE